MDLLRENEWRTVPLIQAYCYECDKLWEECNAHAVGAKHARRYGHHVVVDRTVTYVYDHRSEA